MKAIFVEGLPALENQTVTGYFVAGTRQVRSAKDGSPYLALTLCDRTGQLEGRMWDASDAGEFLPGDLVKVRGQVCRYNEKLQIKLEKLRRVAEETDGGEFELRDFVPHTSFEIDELWARLLAHLHSFTNGHLRALVLSFLEDPALASALREAPAAKSMHHAWIGGLLEHIVSLCDLAALAAGHYQAVDCDLLLTGAILHDIGKLEELRWGTTFEYTLPGQLLGHISLGVNMVETRAALLPEFPPRLKLLVQHMILAHHGRYEFGSPKLPMIPEALLLHYLDDLEAKMQTVQSELSKAVAAGRAPGAMTDWVRALERPLLDTRAFLAGED